jgi:hypothetical protein
MRRPGFVSRIDVAAALSPLSRDAIEGRRDLISLNPGVEIVRSEIRRM